MSIERCAHLIYKDLDFFNGYTIATTYFSLNKMNGINLFERGWEKSFTSPAHLRNCNISGIKKRYKMCIHKNTNHPLYFLCTNVYSNR